MNKVLIQWSGKNTEYKACHISPLFLRSLSIAAVLRLTSVQNNKSCPAMCQVLSAPTDFQRTSEELPRAPQCPNTAPVSVPIHSSFTSPGVQFTRPLVVAAAALHAPHVLRRHQPATSPRHEVRSSPHLNTAAPTNQESEGECKVSKNVDRTRNGSLD